MAPLSRPLRIHIGKKEFPAVGRQEGMVVLRDIAIEIEPRSFVVLTGPSGVGKSTLLNIVAGLDREFEGDIDLGEGSGRLAYIFQTPRLLPWRTVAQNVSLVLPDGDPRQALVPDLLQRVGLAEAADAYPERISVGMQRRVALARGFVLEPGILLMDEPFVSLDDPTAQDLRELLYDLWSRRPTTVLFVTHDRTEAVMLGTRILRLSGGSATIAQDEMVRLSRAERLNREAVLAEQKRIFGAI